MGELFEWFRSAGWVAWGVLGVGLAILEIFTLDLTFLMLAAGAFAAGVTWFIVPDLLWLQVVVALLTAVLTLWLLRPTLLHKVRSSPGYRSSLDTLMGAGGTATAEITSSAGEVRVEGQLWEARPYDGQTRILEGQSVEVFGMDGVTLLVHPAAPQQIPRRH